MDAKVCQYTVEDRNDSALEIGLCRGMKGQVNLLKRGLSAESGGYVDGGSVVGTCSGKSLHFLPSHKCFAYSLNLQALFP